MKRGWREVCTWIKRALAFAVRQRGVSYNDAMLCLAASLESNQLQRQQIGRLQHDLQAAMEASEMNADAYHESEDNVAGIKKRIQRDTAEIRNCLPPLGMGPEHFVQHGPDYDRLLRRIEHAVTRLENVASGQVV